jgi:hypothetical protein
MSDMCVIVTMYSLTYFQFCAHCSQLLILERFEKMEYCSECLPYTEKVIVIMLLPVCMCVCLCVCPYLFACVFAPVWMCLSNLYLATAVSVKSTIPDLRGQNTLHYKVVGLGVFYAVRVLSNSMWRKESERKILPRTAYFHIPHNYDFKFYLPSDHHRAWETKPVRSHKVTCQLVITEMHSGFSVTLLILFKHSASWREQSSVEGALQCNSHRLKHACCIESRL